MSVYCNCKQPEPEEVERGLIVCLNCNQQILQSEDAPEPDDFSEGQDVIDVEEMNDKAEQGMYRDFEQLHDCGRI